MSIVCPCHAKPSLSLGKSVSSQVKSSLSLCELCLDFTFVNKLHLGSLLRSPSVESLQRVNSVIINVITEINYRCNYIWYFYKYKYNTKTCMYTISALY